ncbi:MAG: ATPase [Moraxella sp.]|nr:MAG: ATPase [Moraxella sp.]
MINFNQLSPYAHKNCHSNPKPILKLWQDFYKNPNVVCEIKNLITHIDDYHDYQKKWRNDLSQNQNDDELTQWLIHLFNNMFAQTNMDGVPTILVRGDSEPEYFASRDGNPARIEFAHGFFASALHEISHWCVAGKKRRQLDDFGYWYVADGRDEATQKLFEQVEIKPQAIECLLNLALGRYFYVSQDNLNADFDTSNSTFASDVYLQAYDFLQNPQFLSKDAKRLIWLFLDLCCY